MEGSARVGKKKPSRAYSSQLNRSGMINFGFSLPIGLLIKGNFQFCNQQKFLMRKIIRTVESKPFAAESSLYQTFLSSFNILILILIDLGVPQTFPVDLEAAAAVNTLAKENQKSTPT